MCGRYALFSDLERVSREFGVEQEPSFSFTPRDNIAPSQYAPVVCGAGARRLALMRWGLVPFWAREEKIGNRLINARAETVTEKPAFRDAFRRRRLVVPADGYYEWKRTPSGKIPHFIRRADGGLLALAGLWETWKREGGETLHSFCIITVPAKGVACRIHHRMPLQLAPEQLDTWLHAPPVEAARLLRAEPRAGLEARPRAPAGPGAGAVVSRPG